MDRSSVQCLALNNEDIICESRAGWDAGHVAEMTAILVTQFTPRLDQRLAISRDIGEMPVEAAFCDREPAA